MRLFFPSLYPLHTHTISWLLFSSQWADCGHVSFAQLPSACNLSVVLTYICLYSPCTNLFFILLVIDLGGGMPFYFLLGDIFDFNTSTFSITDVYNILICPYTPLDFILGLQRGKLRESYIGSTMQQLYMIGWNSIRSGIFASNTTIWD